MRYSFTWKVAALGLLASGPAARAQGWIGLANSNYGGTQNLHVNPSSIADSRHRLYVNVVSLDLNFYNTYLQLDLPAAPWQAGFSFSTRYLNEQLTGGTKFASITAEARLPALLLGLGKGRGLAFSNRLRSITQVSNVSENLARLGRYGLGDAPRLGLADRLLEDNSFNISLSNYHEFAFSYAQPLTHNTTHFLKAGLTVKYLVGLGGGYLINDGTRYRVYARDSIQLDTPNLGYGFSDYQIYDRPDFELTSLYGSNRLGQGWGADVGLTYEWRPGFEKYNYHMDGRDWTDPSRNKYKLRLGLALTDLGGIRYRHADYVRQATLVNTRTVQVGQLDTLSFNTLQSIGPTVQRLVGLREQSTAFTSSLPATLRFTADYRVAWRFYAGLLWNQNLLPISAIGSRSISNLALTPRLEFSHAEVAVPLILANNYQKFQVGAMARLGPLLVGSDNLGGLFGITTTTGADFYFGLGFALHRHRHKDRDGDQISNRLDKCPKEKGTWENRGCPTAR